MLWWEEGVIYQIYPRSFADSNGDGIGDLPGITSKLDYVANTLGVDAIWLSPHYPSPQDDFGYDVADYCDVDPMYGTLADFDDLVAEAHRLGLRVIVDYVINHSSDRHPWFLESAADETNPKRDWYVWRDGGEEDRLPNNWPSFFGGPAWSRHPATNQYYLHSFLASQPDLNWRNPELGRAMFDVLRFWMDRGVDGFRIDVAARAMKDPFLRSNPPAKLIDPTSFKFNPEWAATEHIYDGPHPDIHVLFRQLRKVVDEYEDRYAVGEIHEWNWERWASYYGKGDELHQTYNFSLLVAGVDAPKIRAIIAGMEQALPDGAWPNWVAGNHDEVRIATRLGGLEQARAMAVMLLTLRGTPTIYYGDELGMVELAVPAESSWTPSAAGCPGWEGMVVVPRCSGARLRRPGSAPASPGCNVMTTTPPSMSRANSTTLPAPSRSTADCSSSVVGSQASREGQSRWSPPIPRSLCIAGRLPRGRPSRSPPISRLSRQDIPSKGHCSSRPTSPVLDFRLHLPLGRQSSSSKAG